ncbi:hypothetical protein Tco_1025244, partial [Tanacetum coccineum]
VVSNVIGGILSIEARDVDTKLLSAPESNNTLARCWFRRNVPVTMFRSWHDKLLTLVAGCISYTGEVETDIQEKDKKKAKNKQNQARNGKDKVKSKPKSVKVKKSTGKSTPTKSKVNQMKKIQLEGLKLPNLKLYYKNKKTRAEIAMKIYEMRGQNCQLTQNYFPAQQNPRTGHRVSSTLLPCNLYNPLSKSFPPPSLSPPPHI